MNGHNGKIIFFLRIWAITPFRLYGFVPLSTRMKYRYLVFFSLRERIFSPSFKLIIKDEIGRNNGSFLRETFLR